MSHTEDESRLVAETSEGTQEMLSRDGTTRTG